MIETEDEKLYIILVNGEFVSHPKYHTDESKRGKVVMMNGMLMRSIVQKMLHEQSPNEVGDNFQVFRVR